MWHIKIIAKPDIKIGSFFSSICITQILLNILVVFFLFDYIAIILDILDFKNSKKWLIQSRTLAVKKYPMKRHVTQGFQHFSSVPVLHYLQEVLCIKI